MFICFIFACNLTDSRSTWGGVPYGSVYSIRALDGLFPQKWKSIRARAVKKKWEALFHYALQETSRKVENKRDISRLKSTFWDYIRQPIWVAQKNCLVWMNWWKCWRVDSIVSISTSFTKLYLNFNLNISTFVLNCVMIKKLNTSSSHLPNSIANVTNSLIWFLTDVSTTTYGHQNKCWQSMCLQN